MERALARVEGLSAEDSPRELAQAWSELGEVYADHARHVEALEAAREALRLWEAVGDSAELAGARNQLGLYHFTRAHYDSAVVHLDRARDLWIRLDDRRLLGLVLNNLGATHFQWGNYEPALSSFLQALEYRRETGDRRGEALVLANVGRTYHDWGQYDRARAAFDESIRIADEVGDPFVQGYSRHNLATLHFTLEEWDRAEALFESSLEHYEAEGTGLSPSEVAGGWSLNSLGLAMVQVGRGNPAGALPLLHEVLSRARALEHPRREARARLELGRAYRAAGRLVPAAEHLEEGLAVAREWDQRPLALDMLAELVDVREELGDPRRALAASRAHLALRDSIFSQSAAQSVAAMEARTDAESRLRENQRLREEQRVREAVIQRQRAVVFLGGALLILSGVLVAVLVRFNREGRRREEALAGLNQALERANGDLRAALSEVHTLKGFIPICAHCKKVRDDEGFWKSVESYISDRSEAQFSHSICAECGPDAYGADWAEVPSDPGSASIAGADPIRSYATPDDP